MASDGPSKPRVPPPPVLGGASGSTPRSGGAKTSSGRGDATRTDEDAPPSETTDDDAWLALIDDAPSAPETVASEDSEELPTIAASPAPDHAGPEAAEPEEAEPEEAESPPPVRRGVLPPPRSEGKRVQPLASKSSRARGPQRPSATGLPSGLRPPGAPEERERENTDVLIASAVAALTHEAAASDDAPQDESAAASRSGAAAAVPPAATTASGDEEPSRKGLWIGVAALAAAVLLLAVFATGDEEDDGAPETSSAAAVVSKSDEAAPGPQDDPPAQVAAEPDEPDAAAPDLGGDVLALSDAPDVGTDVGLEQALDVGSPESPESEGDTDAGEGDTDGPEDDAEDAEPTRSAKRRKSRRRRKREEPAKQPAASGQREEEEPDADALLAAAQKALRSGQSRKAYSLASKSRRAKKSTGALVVMARAACRFGGESQAKSAFDKLTIGERRGIRAECRDHGVRLGL